MADTVTVTIHVGEPHNPVVAVSRSETVVVGGMGDPEHVVLEAMAMVERLTSEVKDEAIRQAGLVRENMREAQARGGSG